MSNISSGRILESNKSLVMIFKNAAFLERSVTDLFSAMEQMAKGDAKSFFDVQDHFKLSLDETILYAENFIIEAKKWKAVVKEL